MSTTDPALKLQALADAIATAVGSIEGLLALSYDPTGRAIVADTVCVSEAQGGQPDPLEASLQLGFRDWPTVWTLVLYVPLKTPANDWPRARGYIGKITTGIDTDPTLGGECTECSLVDWTLKPNEAEASARFIIGELQVSVAHYQPNP